MKLEFRAGGYSRGAVDNYSREVRRFFDWIDLPPGKIRSEHILLYLQQPENHLSARSAQKPFENARESAVIEAIQCPKIFCERSSGGKKELFRNRSAHTEQRAAATATVYLLLRDFVKQRLSAISGRQRCCLPGTADQLPPVISNKIMALVAILSRTIQKSFQQSTIYT